MLRTIVLSMFVVLTASCAHPVSGNVPDSSLWNEAFKTKNVARLEGILSDDFQFASAGGKCTTSRLCLEAFESLMRKRPDLTWDNHPTDVHINQEWRVAYEHGDWMETWTEPDGRAEIRGKYFAMWKLKDGLWTLHAMISTPLSCIGESAYCVPKI